VKIQARENAAAMPQTQEGAPDSKAGAHLESILKGKVVILGIGNRLRGDDGFGPALMDRLRGKIRAACIDAGTVPESYAGKVARENPDTILLVDAAHLARAPGEFEILDKDAIAEVGFTTHDMSPRLVIAYLDKETGAAIYMLAVQPESVAFGEGLSPSVARALDCIRDLLCRRLGPGAKP